ncbi:MAG: chromate transporter [Chthoniobacterales bacterium]
MVTKNFQILAVFSLLSILAVGGGTAVLPEMKHLTIEAHPWLTDAEFRDIYSLGQLAPGPNMLMVVVIGFHIAGIAGAMLAFFGFFLPSGLITWGTSRVWDHFEKSPWRECLQKALAPVIVGLMAAGLIAIARTTISNELTIVIAVSTFVLLYFGRKINPALLIIGGGIVGVFFLR